MSLAGKQSSPSFVARWTVDVPFGNLEPAIDAMQRWRESVASELGWKGARVIRGCVGAPETTLILEVNLDSLDAFSSGLQKQRYSEQHAEVEKEIGRLMTPGSSGWQVFEQLHDSKSLR